MTIQGLKRKMRQEMVEYVMNVIYLTFVFGAFTLYRRLLLAAHDITYTNYGVALIEAMILGKVIMIGSVLRLGRGLENKPLIFATVYKTAVFCALVALFKVIEHGIKGLIKGEGFMEGAAEMTNKGLYELLANTLVVFVSLLPFFAVKELGRVLGRQTIRDLFFRRHTGAAPGPESGT
jgi:hypothetical protein